jgi:hypothetical protein
MHLWPHRDGANLGIVEGGPHRGACSIVTAVVAEAVVLAFPLPLAITLAFVTVVGVGGSRWKAIGGHDSSWCGGRGGMSYPIPRNRERSLHTCAQDVQITRMATI